MVTRSSIVPLFLSSLKSLMVIAGAKKIKMNGIMENTLRKDESSARKSSLVKNHPVRRRNTEMTMYAIGEKK